jgi:hypothetical protein
MADGMPDDAYVLTLKKPITVEGRELTEITIKEPTAGQMAMAEQTSRNGGEVGQGIALLALACGVTPIFIKQMCGSDYVKAQKVLGNFFDDAPATGEIS